VVGNLTLVRGSKMEYIEKVFTENTGGNNMVDFIILKDGRCVGINDECIVLYKSYDAVYEAFDDDSPQAKIDLV
jgi:hypothetical protein